MILSAARRRIVPAYGANDDLPIVGSKHVMPPGASRFENRTVFLVGRVAGPMHGGNNFLKQSGHTSPSPRHGYPAGVPDADSRNNFQNEPSTHGTLAGTATAQAPAY
jgi:hypothetical protein